MMLGVVLGLVLGVKARGRLVKRAPERGGGFLQAPAVSNHGTCLLVYRVTAGK